MREIEIRMHDLGGFIREQRRVARLSLRKLSELAGISNPYLSQIERGLRRPSAEILQQIARALRISAETLYVQAGILEERGDNQDLVRDILSDPGLTETQKRTLIQVYAAFLHENGPSTVAPANTPAAAPADIATPAEISAPAPTATSIPAPADDPAPDHPAPDHPAEIPAPADDPAPDHPADIPDPPDDPAPAAADVPDSAPTPASGDRGAQGEPE